MENQKFDFERFVLYETRDLLSNNQIREESVVCGQRDESDQFHVGRGAVGVEDCWC